MDPTLNLVVDGVRLSVVGMGTVFVFLGVLVLATSLMSRLIMRFAPAPAPAPAPLPAPAPPALGDDPARLLVVIGAAVHAHRSRQDHSA